MGAPKPSFDDSQLVFLVEHWTGSAITEIASAATVTAAAVSKIGGHGSTVQVTEPSGRVAWWSRMASTEQPFARRSSAIASAGFKSRSRRSG